MAAKEKEINWVKMRNEYITSDLSYRKLCDKYGTTVSHMRARAKRENWVAERAEYRKKLHRKTIEQTAQANARAEVKRIERIGSITDRLLDKLEKAVDELEISLFIDTEKTKSQTYDDEGNRIEKEYTEQIPKTHRTIIDKSGLKQLASTLKDLKEVQKAINGPDEAETGGVILMPPILEEDEDDMETPT